MMVTIPALLWGCNQEESPCLPVLVFGPRGCFSTPLSFVSTSP
jgi:hypothetical protein